MTTNDMRKRAKCPVHHVVSTFTADQRIELNENGDEIQFTFLVLDECGCRYAVTIDTPGTVERNIEIAKLWVRVRELSAAGDYSGMSRTQNMIAKAELGIRAARRAAWNKYKPLVDGPDLIGAAEALTDAAFS